MEMQWYWAFATLIGMVMFLMAMGVPVAFTFIITNVVGALLFMGDYSAWAQIVDNSTSMLTRPVPCCGSSTRISLDEASALLGWRPRAQRGALLVKFVILQILRVPIVQHFGRGKRAPQSPHQVLCPVGHHADDSR